MAAHERLGLQTSIAHHILTDQLAKVLTKGANFKIYYVSTPPTRTPALFSSAPGERPDRTFCEKNFLAISINIDAQAAHVEEQRAKEVLVYAIEVLVYSTAHTTTFFVSKADSTGYLQLLNLPKGTPSPLKDISAIFLSHLVESRKRLSVRSIVSLFARAQSQYLFPGSADNAKKHVLDDRGLIKWWCRVLNPLAEGTHDGFNIRLADAEPWESVKGFLTVPGLDDHDVKSYLPKKLNGSAATSWTVGNPLSDLAGHQNTVLPRCLVPRFPDDPKSRFLDELDEELSTSDGKVINGEWRSIKTLDQFWEMMAFRQECSAGRLVGFIWIVFEPHSILQPEDPGLTDSQSSVASRTSNFIGDDETLPDLPTFPPASPNSSLAMSSQGTLKISPSKLRRISPSNSDQTVKPFHHAVSKKRRLSGPVIPRQPRVKTHNRMYTLERPEKTSYYVWPPESRGQVVLDNKDYTRVTELLLHLDFTTIDLARSSTERWISEVRSGLSSNATNKWGSPVIGIRALEVKAEDGKLGGIRTLNVGLVRKKRKAPTEEASNT